MSSETKNELVMPTPVKTMFVSVIVMMKMMVEYRDVVKYCFSNQEEIKLKQGIHSVETSEKVQIICETWEPVMRYSFLSQKAEIWV